MRSKFCRGLLTLTLLAFTMPAFAQVHQPRTAEIFNDAFTTDDGIHGITPWWLATHGGCSHWLEVGDVVEGLPQNQLPHHHAQ